MRRFRFTAQALAALTTTKSREYVHDDQVPALAVLVTAKGAKSFYVVKRHSRGKMEQRLAAVGEMPIPKARAMAAEIISSLAAGDTRALQRKRPLYMSQVIEEYLAYAKEHRSTGTQRNYNHQWERFIKPWAGGRPLGSIRRREVTAFHQHIGQNHGRLTANRVLAFLRAAINRAIREHELDLPNPARSITLYSEESRTRRLEREEMPAFLAALAEEPNHNVRDMLTLALFTGARKSNIMAMRWDEISFDRGLWVVPPAKSKTGHTLPVVLSSHALEILKARRELVTGPYVFPGAMNGHMGSPYHAWNRLLARAGLSDLRIHDLRRSLASFQIDMGTPLEVIQKTLGHESKVTTEIYARLATGPVRASLEQAVDEMLRSGKI